jgi:oligopeptide/dipeptide ABC transporter ATP-binding protein
VAVMYLGRIVEFGATAEVVRNPKHPYTRALMSAVPVPRPEARRERIVLQGDPPSPSAIPSGCRFHTRCPDVMDICRRDDPAETVLPGGRSVFCHLHSPARLAAQLAGVSSSESKTPSIEGRDAL